MNWTEIRKTYPDQWLVIEALQAHTPPDHRRVLDQLAVIETCSDGSTAMQRYRHLHQTYPQREFYFVRASREALDIRERHWNLGNGLSHEDWIGRVKEIHSHIYGCFSLTD